MGKAAFSAASLRAAVERSPLSRPLLGASRHQGPLRRPPSVTGFPFPLLLLSVQANETWGRVTLTWPPRPLNEAQTDHRVPAVYPETGSTSIRRLTPAFKELAVQQTED